METQTQPLGPWCELQGSAIDFDKPDLRLRFVLLQRGEERGGAWFVAGRPALLIPAGEA